MDGTNVNLDISLDLVAINHLMPMHLCLDPSGYIVSAGSTMSKLFATGPVVHQSLFDVFEIRRPSGITCMAHLLSAVGKQLYLYLRDSPLPAIRGVAVQRSNNQGLLLNFSFGIGVIDAVRQYGLTNADFSPTDLAVELMYLVEAKSAVMDELRDLNLRLQGAKTVAEEQALTDTLTGLRNRRALDHVLSGLLRYGTPFSLMHIDLDYFKAVNDTLGHAAGDYVLSQVAKVLCAETRIGDTVARIGGDEFVVVLPMLADPEILKQIAGRIIARLNEDMQFEGQTCHIAASIGMTLSSLYASVDPQKMLNDADQALYASKHAGRAQATLFDAQNDDNATY